jgi:signal transduction histidine kinase
MDEQIRTQINEPRLPAGQAQAVALPSDHSAVDLMTILAHDLRNYITPLRGRLAMLHRRAQHEQREQDMRLAASATQALERMERLIATVLDTARLERAFFELIVQPVDLVLLARQTAELLQTDDIPILLDLPETAIYDGDGERLGQVLHNLLSNAIQHSPSRAAVRLRLAVETRDGGTWMVVTVCDRGTGISPEVLPRIFERFAAGPGSRGLGLGLYLARGIAEAHCGTLTVQSSSGGGTCFELALPVGAPSLAETRVNRSSTRARRIVTVSSRHMSQHRAASSVALTRLGDASGNAADTGDP